MSDDAATPETGQIPPTDDDVDNDFVTDPIDPDEDDEEDEDADG